MENMHRHRVRRTIYRPMQSSCASDCQHGPAVRSTQLQGNDAEHAEARSSEKLQEATGELSQILSDRHSRLSPRKNLPTEAALPSLPKPR